MSWILVGGAIFCGWAMLRTMGGERERRVLEERHATLPSPPAVSRAAEKASTPKRPPRQAA